MTKTEGLLRQIRGIGKVMAVRFAEAGLDSYEKIARADEDRLKDIRGLNPRAIPSIRTQAAELAGTVETSQEERIAQLKTEAGEVRMQVVTLAEGVRTRLGEELEGKKGRRLEKEIFRLLDTLERMENGRELRPKRAGRGLAKARRRLEEIGETGAKKTRKRLKRARRALERAQG